jgi:hypothetical protein
MVPFWDVVRHFFGGEKKKVAYFKTDKQAYDFCREAYKKSGGVTPELRRAYEFYMKNNSDGCEPFVDPSKYPGQAVR